MKRHISFVLSIFCVLVSCTKQYWSVSVDSEAAAMDLSVSIDTLITKSSYQSTTVPFRLYATNDGVQYIPVTEMSYVDSRWKWGDGTVEHYWWPSDATKMKFYCVMDCANAGAVTARTLNPSSPASISVTSVSGDEDLCVCYKEPEKVKMTEALQLIFKHAYTKFCFKLKAADASAASLAYEIESLNVSARQEGTLTIASTPSWASGDPTGADKTYAVSGYPTGRQVLGTTAGETFGSKMIIPQDEVIISISYKVYESASSTDPIASVTKMASVDMSSNMGKSATYVLSLDGNADINEMDVTCSITDWNSQNIIVGVNNFSVSSSKQVLFTKGNLYWKGSSFHFESSQTSCPTSWNAYHVGHFFWTSYDDFYSGNSSYMPYASSYSYSSQSSSDELFCSESHPLTVEGVPGIYYAMNRDEWNYLLNTRSASTINGTPNARYALVQVKSRKGLLLFPDLFKWPYDVSSKPSTFNTNESNWNGVNYTDAEFTALESAGCVFLPLASSRYDTTIYTSVYVGYYFISSTNKSESGTSLIFSTSTVAFGNIDRGHGCSIRLVYTVD